MERLDRRRYSAPSVCPMNDLHDVTSDDLSIVYIAEKLNKVGRNRLDDKHFQSVLHEICSLSVWKAILVEMLASCIHLAVVVGATNVYTDYVPSPLHLSLAAGLAVTVSVQCFSHLSGAVLNPAVTLALLIVGRVTPFRAALYCLVQILGSAAGAAIIYGCVVVDGEVTSPTLGVNQLSKSISAIQGCGLEVVMTYVLTTCVLACVDTNRPSTGSPSVAIGLTVIAANLSVGKLTGASMNPARSMGPAIVMNHWDNHWIYWVGPFLGALIAGLVYRFAFNTSKELVSLRHVLEELGPISTLRSSNMYQDRRRSTMEAAQNTLLKARTAAMQAKHQNANNIAQVLDTKL